MSKKLIAVASASVLALSALVGVAPATALPFSEDAVTTVNGIQVTLAGNAIADGSGSNSDAYEVDVPSAGTVELADIMKIAVSTTIKSRAITVSTTSGIKLLDAPGDSTNKYTAASGSSSWSSTTDASGAAVFYAFPTTTTKGIITVTLDGDVTQIYVTGVAGPAYDITSVTLPSLEVKGEDVILATVTDAFGNAIVDTSNTALTLAVTAVGTGANASTSETVAYSGTSKRWEGPITAGETAGQLAVQVTLDAEETDATKAAFGAANKTFFGIINVAAAGDVKALRAEIAALKADYNKLAARWNKRVADKKAPKKKVATK
jgi:hypothetical protein